LSSCSREGGDEKIVEPKHVKSTKSTTQLIELLRNYLGDHRLYTPVWGRILRKCILHKAFYVTFFILVNVKDDASLPQSSLTQI